jgi:DNA methyltransferase 1-associated protein 1
MPLTVSCEAVRMLTTDVAHCIYRVPPPVVLPNTSHLAAKHPPHVPAFVRSTKLPVPRSSAILRINELMEELGVETQRLVMPTRGNLDALDGVLVAGAALVDMKRQVDRVEQELRTLRAQREAYVAPLNPRGVRPITRDPCMRLIIPGAIRVGGLDCVMNDLAARVG